ncbi:hypothetical protein JHK85_002473 [Glycine max]|nr:hypothetical protein JHK85_002473 [Glycine max]KAG5089798.1 hypothetical protein JHK86_002410 [Glycine max]
MELKSFSFNSEMVLVGRTRTCPALLSNSSSVRFCSQLNCFGAVTSSVGPDNLAAETSFHHINGTNGSISSLCSRNLRVLDASDDVYEGVVIDSDRLPDNPSTFAANLRFSLHHWKKVGKKGIWLRLPSEQSDFVPIAIKEGFRYHHAEPGYVMLTYWIPEGPFMLPANASHQVGVGGFVISGSNEVLVVQEKQCAPANCGLWKIPTRFVLQSEELYAGAIREVKEETGWMPQVEFVEQPFIQEDSMFKKIIDICMACLEKHYCGLTSHQMVCSIGNAKKMGL